MWNCSYEIVMQTPLGEKQGTAEVAVGENDVKGTLNILKGHPSLEPLMKKASAGSQEHWKHCCARCPMRPKGGLQRRC